MNIFITGGAGFLGNHIVRETLSRGHDVTVLCQPGVPVRGLDDLDVRTVEGDLLDPESLGSLVHGHDAVIHVAAAVSTWPPRNPMIRKVNVRGTQGLIVASSAAGVRRFVHVGSGSAFGFGNLEAPGTEDSPFQGYQYGLDYIDTKKEGADMVREAAKKGFPAVLVHPTFMVGPMDFGPGPGRLILGVLEEKTPGFPKGGRCFVDVRDVAAATVNALDKGEIGRDYILGGHNRCYKEYFELIADIAGVKTPKLFMSPFVVKAFGGFMTIVARLLRKAPLLSLQEAQVSLEGQYYDASRAVTELGMTQRPLEETLTDTIRWFWENGYWRNPKIADSSLIGVL